MIPATRIVHRILQRTPPEFAHRAAINGLKLYDLLWLRPWAAYRAFWLEVQSYIEDAWGETLMPRHGEIPFAVASDKTVDALKAAWERPLLAPDRRA